MATLQELSAKLKNLLPNIIKEHKQRILTVYLNELEGQMKKRIFEKGQAADGSQIGKYSTEPIYVNPNKLPAGIARGGFKIGGKPPKGKRKGAKISDIKRKGELFAVETKHATAYMEYGYKEFREKANLKTDKVNLRASGDASDSLKVGIQGEIMVLGFSTQFASDKMRGNEEHFKGAINTIFVPTAEEKALALKAAQKEFQVIMKGITI